MNNYDVSGLLTTYAKKVCHARDDKHLKGLVRQLKEELNSKEISKLRVAKED